MTTYYIVILFPKFRGLSTFLPLSTTLRSHKETISINRQPYFIIPPKNKRLAISPTYIPSCNIFFSTEDSIDNYNTGLCSVYRMERSFEHKEYSLLELEHTELLEHLLAP